MSIANKYLEKNVIYDNINGEILESISIHDARVAMDLAVYDFINEYHDIFMDLTDYNDDLENKLANIKNKIEKKYRNILK